MPESLLFKIDNEIIEKFSRHRVGEDVAIKLFGEIINVFDNGIINGCIVFRLSPASLFKNFPDEVAEVYTF